MSDELELIRARWAEQTLGSLVTGAHVSDASGHILIDIDGPTPGDMRAVLARLDRAEVDAVMKE